LDKWHCLSCLLQFVLCFLFIFCQWQTPFPNCILSYSTVPYYLTPFVYLMIHTVMKLIHEVNIEMPFTLDLRLVVIRLRHDCWQSVRDGENCRSTLKMRDETTKKIAFVPSRSDRRWRRYLRKGGMRISESFFFKKWRPNTVSSANSTMFINNLLIL